MRYCEGRRSGFNVDAEFEMLREAIRNEPEKGKCQSDPLHPARDAADSRVGKEMMQGTNLRRTIIVALQFFFNVRVLGPFATPS